MKNFRKFLNFICQIPQSFPLCTVVFAKLLALNAFRFFRTSRPLCAHCNCGCCCYCSCKYALVMMIVALRMQFSFSCCCIYATVIVHCVLFVCLNYYLIYYRSFCHDCVRFNTPVC